MKENNMDIIDKENVIWEFLEFIDDPERKTNLCLQYKVYENHSSNDLYRPPNGNETYEMVGEYLDKYPDPIPQEDLENVNYN